MTAVTNPAPDAAEVGFKRGAQRVWEKDRRVKTWLPADQTTSGKKEVVRKSNSRVHLWNQFPHRRNFRGCSYSDVCIGAPTFDRAHGRRAHPGVPQPLAGANENSKWLQVRRNAVWQVNTA